MAIQLVSSSDYAGAADPVYKAPRQAPAVFQASSEAVANPTPERIRQAVHDIRRAVEPIANNLYFSIDQESGKTVIRVVDSKTREFIRQIPSEELISISHALSRLAGLLVQAKA